MKKKDSMTDIKSFGGFTEPYFLNENEKSLVITSVISLKIEVTHTPKIHPTILADEAIKRLYDEVEIGNENIYFRADCIDISDTEVEMRKYQNAIQRQASLERRFEEIQEEGCKYGNDWLEVQRKAFEKFRYYIDDRDIEYKVLSAEMALSMIKWHNAERKHWQERGERIGNTFGILEDGK